MFETERLILQEINLRRRLRRGFGKGFSLRSFANNGFWTTLFYRCIITVTFVASVAEQPENPNEVVSLFALVAFLCFLWQGVRLHTLCTDNAEHLRNVFYVQEDRYAVARTIKTFIEFSLVASVDVVLLAAALAIQGNVDVA